MQDRKIIWISRGEKLKVWDDESKTILKPQYLASAHKAYRNCIDDFLEPSRQLANVVGMGIGVKWSNNRPTGEPALIVLVTHKRAKEELGSASLIPEKIEGFQTDVLAIGHPCAGGGMPAMPGMQTLASHRIRPVKGGYSIGHRDISAGTIATSVYDLLPKTGAYENGRPPKFYILSNNHILAKNNLAKIGDPIIQPGTEDGGLYPWDQIATLSRFIPIEFDPPIPRDQHNNIVDAAIAEGDFRHLDREIYWIGHTRGWMPQANVTVGERVQKTGRTTNYTVGRITAINATIDINYGTQTARFRDQIITTAISAGGDSGSLVTTLDNIAVGLLFAGSPSATIVNQIENVCTLLHIEIPGGMIPGNTH